MLQIDNTTTIQTDSTSALTVKNNAGTSVFRVDSVNEEVNIYDNVKFKTVFKIKEGVRNKVWTTLISEIPEGETIINAVPTTVSFNNINCACAIKVYRRSFNSSEVVEIFETHNSSSVGSRTILRVNGTSIEVYQNTGITQKIKYRMFTTNISF
jgi:hypothetical protein